MPWDPYDVPVSQSWQGYTLNPEDPADTPLDDAVGNPVAEIRPMRMSPFYQMNQKRWRVSGVSPMMKRWREQNMRQYWNPQTKTWDKDKADGVSYQNVVSYNFETGVQTRYNFDTGEYEEYNPVDRNKFNPMSPNFSLFGEMLKDR